MKKIFLFLALFAWTNVSAETKYTEYEFQGYTEEKLENDELYRYEETKFNRFYSETETDATYLEGLDKQGYDRVDETDFYKQEYTKQTFTPGYENEERIVVYVASDIELEKIGFDEAPNFFDTVSNLKIFSNDIELDYTFEINEDTIEIDLGGTYNYLDLNFYLEYKTDTGYAFKYRVLRPNGKPLRNKIELNSDFESTTIYSLIGDDFQAFIRKYHFTFYEVLHYYCYERIFYRHYNLERTYYTDSEETEIEGYSFDPEESYILYKVYKRDIIEEPKEPTTPELPTESEEKDESSNENRIEESKENENSNSELPSSTVPNPVIVKENITNIYKYESPIAKVDEETTDDDIDTSEPTTPEVTCNCNIPEQLLIKEQPNTCEENTRSEILKSIGEVLMIIALLQFILYEISVKRKNKND